jgi:acetoacetate decarboxylase
VAGELLCVEIIRGVLTAKGTAMKEAEVRERAFAMPLTSPAFPRGPYRFCQREYLIIEYRTHFEKLKALVPEPLEVHEPIVKYEFIRIRIRPGLATTRKPDKSSRYRFAAAGAVIRIACS